VDWLESEVSTKSQQAIFHLWGLSQKTSSIRKYRNGQIASSYSRRSRCCKISDGSDESVKSILDSVRYSNPITPWAIAMAELQVRMLSHFSLSAVGYYGFSSIRNCIGWETGKPGKLIFWLRCGRLGKEVKKIWGAFHLRTRVMLRKSESVQTLNGVLGRNAFKPRPVSSPFRFWRSMDELEFISQDLA